MTKQKTAKIKIESKKISELKIAPYNCRIMDDDTKKALGKSIEFFGYVEPIVWNQKTGNVISGHQRLERLVSMGIEVVDVVVVEMDDTKEKALNVTPNNMRLRGLYGNGFHSLMDEIKTNIPEDLFSEIKLDELLKEIGPNPVLTGFEMVEIPNISSNPQVVESTCQNQIECPKCGALILLGE